jgi:hypothetical protein
MGPTVILGKLVDIPLSRHALLGFPGHLLDTKGRSPVFDAERNSMAVAANRRGIFNSVADIVTIYTANQEPVQHISSEVIWLSR